MASISPLIIDVSPADQAAGIPIGEHVEVTFNQEMDRSSVNTGTFLVIGKDEAPIFGPIDVTPLDEPGFEDEDILSSPYFGAHVKGKIEFYKIDASGGVIDDDSIVDEEADGMLWKTRAVFVPDQPLAVNSEYTVFLLGDENTNDSLDTGVRTRTVFDTKEVAVTGTGSVTFGGGYSASEERTYALEIIVPGSTGVAEYRWWDEAHPLNVYEGRTTTGIRELEDGIFVTCSNDGDFETGDKFSVKVVPYLLLENNYQWIFTTGSGSIVTPPSDSSASGIECLNTEGESGGLEIVSTDPEDRETNLDPASITTVTIVFNKALDAATITNDTVKVIAEPVNGDPRFTAQGELTQDITVTGSTISIAINQDDPIELYPNNIVLIELDETVASTDGSTLGEDVIWYFTTTYTPLYSSIRRIRLDMGILVSDIPDDTINLAIFEASLSADQQTFILGSGAYFEYARREYTTCLAEQILYGALSGDGSIFGKMSKRLGDLSVSRGGNPQLMSNMDDLQECVEKWARILQSGGQKGPYTSILPGIAVKGSRSEDAMATARQWAPSSISSSPAANTSGRFYTSRKGFRTYKKRSSGKYGYYGDNDND
ncbi:MAG: hypothetical protein DRI24_11910 [Deltaproteobacteria bacterium]|nr:MAG: hypothetical protein DRI24_11910 [Deltaproteobacteria bacterium]